MYIPVERPRWHSRVLQAPSSTCPREKCVCVCVTDKGKFVGLNRELINLFQVDDLYGFLPWDSSPFFQLFTTILGEFWTLYDDFPAPFTANLSESITRSFDPRFVVMEKFCWEGSIFESNVQFHDGNLQDYNLFLYLYSWFGAGNHIPTPSVWACIYLLILLMFCH